MRAHVHDTAAWNGAAPRLSVLVPFLRDDPCPLIDRLAGEATQVGQRVELILLDDGTGDPDLTARITARLDASGLPARLIGLKTNEGRSRGRNRLAVASRGTSLLFLDSDMLPDRDDFLTSWLALAERDDPAVAFGGFSLDQAPDAPRFAVHRALALRSDCTPSAQRALQPEKHVFTSNLLVRRDVFEAEAFDVGFTGWGWEDVEWAMRVSRRHPILHPDIPATHMGLDTVAALAAKYEQSAPNFARVAAAHPDIVAAYPSYRMARLLKRTPGMGLARPLLRRLADIEALPTGWRAFSLRLYRVAMYARAL